MDAKAPLHTTGSRQRRLCIQPGHGKGASAYNRVVRCRVTWTLAGASAGLAEMAVHSRDAVAMVNAESGRLLFALNDAADETARRLCAEAGRQESEMAADGRQRCAGSTACSMR